MRRAASLVLAAFLAGCATAGSLVFPSEPKPGTVFHSFIKPDGPGPFPAVVLLHTCGGVGRHMPGWAARLQRIGYASVIVDSFTPRGGTACSIPTYFPATLDQVTEDAFAALAWLRGRSDIDPERIGVMGFSYGASATLRTSSARYRKSAPDGGFRAAAAYYPVCVNPRPDWPAAAQERSNNLFDDIVTPTLILVGADDSDTPNVAQNCAGKVAQLARQGRPITIDMYPVTCIRMPITYSIFASPSPRRRRSRISRRSSRDISDARRDEEAPHQLQGCEGPARRSRRREWRGPRLKLGAT
jgi:dienelactone hydrolase